MLGKVNKTEDETDSRLIKGYREFIYSQKSILSIRSSRFSLSVVGVWAGLTSIPSNSMRTPTAMDSVTGSHP